MRRQQSQSILQALVGLRGCAKFWLVATLLVVMAPWPPIMPAFAEDGRVLGDRAGATRILQRFLAKGADYRALTLALKPTREDYRAAYRQPLADRLADADADMWRDEDMVIEPKEEQTEILLGVTSTDRLIAGHRDFDEFPGGYKKVLEFMKPGVPIARFRFVKPGEKFGMSYDGLIFVNGYWVFIPKTWRVLP